MRVLPGWASLVARHRGGLLRFGAAPEDVARACGGRLVYLATPYSRRVLDSAGRWDRWRGDQCAFEAAGVAVTLMRAGVTAVSPIVQAQAMVVETMWGGDMLDPMDQPMWTAWCAPMLAACGAVFVPEVDGWCASQGVLHEAGAALEACRPVFVGAGALPWDAE